MKMDYRNVLRRAEYLFRETQGFHPSLGYGRAPVQSPLDPEWGPLCPTLGVYVLFFYLKFHGIVLIIPQHLFLIDPKKGGLRAG